MTTPVLVTQAPSADEQPVMELREWRVLEDMDAKLLPIGLHVDSDRVRISRPELRTANYASKGCT